MTEEKIILKLGKAENALARFAEILAKYEAAPSTEFRDASIKRFEFAFETFWKAIRALLEKEGKESNSPRQAFTGAYQLYWIENQQIWIDMIDDRNICVHVYDEAQVDKIFSHFPTYLTEMQKVFDTVSKL